MGLGVWLNYFLIFRKLWQNIFNTFRAKMYRTMLGQPKYIFCSRFVCKSEVLSSLFWKFEVLSFSISFSSTLFECMKNAYFRILHDYNSLSWNNNSCINTKFEHAKVRNYFCSQLVLMFSFSIVTLVGVLPFSVWVRN
jgi:hypothetical protein